MEVLWVVMEEYMWLFLDKCEGVGGGIALYCNTNIN